MNCNFKNFKKLSVKQIKTYAAVIMMSALSFEASAFVVQEGANPDPAIVATIETDFESELALESWMISPFEVILDEGPAIEALLTASSEAEFESELAFESWMAIPFETSVDEASDLDINMCSPTP